MATHISEYDGSISIVGGFKPSGTKPLMEAKDILVGSDNKRLDEVLGNGEGSIQSQIDNALSPYSTTTQIKAFNDMTNYYTIEQLNATSGTGAKIDKSAIQTAITDDSTDSQVPSAKAAYTAIEAAKNAAIDAAKKTDTVEENNSDPVTSGGVYSKLQSYYTKEEAEEKFYVAITVTAKFDKTYTVEFKSSSTATFHWTTNTVPTSVKIAGVEAATSYDKITGSKTVTLTTDSIGSKSIGVAVVDRKGGTASASASYTVGYKVYYGQANENTSPNAAFITGLNSNPPIKTNATGVSFNGNYVAGQFFYIAFPKTFTVPKFSYNGYPTSFTKVGEVTMNINGTDVIYVLYSNPNIFTESTGSYSVATSAT